MMGDMHPGSRVPSKSPAVVQQMARAAENTEATEGLCATQVMLSRRADLLQSSATRDGDAGDGEDDDTASITGRQSTTATDGSTASGPPSIGRRGRLRFSDKGGA